MAFSAPVAVVIQLLLMADGGVGPLPPLREPSLLDPMPRPSVSSPSAKDKGYPLKPAKDGSGALEYVAPEFTARVAPDGTVTFRRTSVSGFRWVPLAPLKTPYNVPTLESTVRELMNRRRPPPPPELDDSVPPPETTTTVPEVSRYRPDPREGCRSCAVPHRTLPLAFGRGDLTDEVQRMNGKDPHRYKKARFLVGTHDMRIRMAVETHAKNLRQAAADLPARLTAIGCDERLSARDRRGILAALRDEMDGGTAEGRAAATQIDAFLARFDGPERADLCPPQPETPASPATPAPVR